MKIDITTTVNVDNEYQADDIAKIFKLLIEKGALQGIRGGKTLIHFDKNARFMGISFDYFVWKEPPLDNIAWRNILKVENIVLYYATSLNLTKAGAW